MAEIELHEAVSPEEAAVIIGEVGVRRFAREDVRLTVHEIAMDTGWTADEVIQTIQDYRMNADRASEPLMSASRPEPGSRGRKEGVILAAIVVIILIALSPFFLWIIPPPR